MDDYPSHATLKILLVYILRIIALILSSRPNLDKALHKASGEMASNIFAQSNARTINASSFEVRILSMIRLIMNRASVPP